MAAATVGTASAERASSRSTEETAKAASSKSRAAQQTTSAAARLGMRSEASTVQTGHDDLDRRTAAMTAASNPSESQCMFRAPGTS